MQVRESLTARAREFNIVLDDVAITHLSFGTEASLKLFWPAYLIHHLHNLQQMEVVFVWAD